MTGYVGRVWFSPKIPKTPPASYRFVHPKPLEGPWGFLGREKFPQKGGEKKRVPNSPRFQIRDPCFFWPPWPCFLDPLTLFFWTPPPCFFCSCRNKYIGIQPKRSSIRRKHFGSSVGIVFGAFMELGKTCLYESANGTGRREMKIVALRIDGHC